MLLRLPGGVWLNTDHVFRLTEKPDGTAEAEILGGNVHKLTGRQASALRAQLNGGKDDDGTGAGGDDGGHLRGLWEGLAA